MVQKHFFPLAIRFPSPAYWFFACILVSPHSQAHSGNKNTRKNKLADLGNKIACEKKFYFFTHHINNKFYRKKRQQKGAVFRINKGLKCTVGTPFHNAGKGQKQYL